MRRLVAAVLAASGTIAACSSQPAAPPVDAETPRSSVVVARVIAEDASFDPATAKRPRFVACQGLSGCARSSPVDGELYPGVTLPPGADDEVDFSAEVLLYLLGARFLQADLVGDIVHVKVEERPTGFQMVKLDAREILPLPLPRFSFEVGSRRVCIAFWDGCNP